METKTAIVKSSLLVIKQILPSFMTMILLNPKKNRKVLFFTLFSRLIENAISTSLEQIEKYVETGDKFKINSSLYMECLSYFSNHATVKRFDQDELMFYDYDDSLQMGFNMTIEENGNKFMLKFDSNSEFHYLHGPNLYTVKQLLEKIRRSKYTSGTYTVYTREHNKVVKTMLPINFDHIVLPENSKIKTHLDRWKTARDYYRKHFIPYKIALLFHGAPGTGKTSAAKAIANYMQYKFIEFRPEETSSSFKYIEEIIISNKKTVFLIDEIDRLIEEYNSTTITEKNVTYSQRGISFTNFLLRLLELQDLDDVVIIFTTNKPKNYFPPALFRAGRIEHSEEFNLCTRQQFEKIYKRYVNDDVPELFPENVFSPAEVIHQICVPYRDNREKIVEILSNPQLIKS